MKKNLVLIGLIFWSGFLVIDSTAQTSKKETTSAKSPAADKTRSRRASTDPTPAASPTPIPSEAQKIEATSETTAKPEEPKSVASPESSEVRAQDQKASDKSESVSTQAGSTVPTSTSPTPVDEIKALRDQIEAASSATERIRLQLKLAEQLVIADKKPEAIEELISISKSDAFDPQGFYNLGNAFARLGESDGAIEAYRKAIDQRKGNYSRASNNLGVVLLRLGRWDESYDALTTALKIENFRYAEASYNLGRLYAARGQADLAAREWRRVLAMNPQHAGAKDALALVRSEDRVSVGPALSTVARQNSAKETIPASAVAEKPTALKPTTTRARPTTTALALDQISYDFLQRARSSIERGNTLDAIDSYKRLLSRQTGYFPLANLELGFAYLSLKREDEALSNLLMVANRDGSRYPISYFHVARIYESKGDFNQAQIAYSKAVVAFGDQNPQFLLDVSRVREKVGDFKGAVESMEKYISLMKQQGQEPSWSEERLGALRQKAAATVKN
jgi:tetratricopeptide (TPR) repeat protein